MAHKVPLKVPINVPVKAVLFSRIIDNYGDAAITLRLALLLLQHQVDVLIYSNDSTPFRKLYPYPIAGLTISSDGAALPQYSAAKVLIVDVLEGAAPHDWVAAMQAHNRVVAWWHYHYLSAEDWPQHCHLHDALFQSNGTVLTRRSFFPGFEPERGLLPNLSHLAQALTPSDDSSPYLEMSLFCYPSPYLEDLLAAWHHSAQQGIKMRCWVVRGMVSEALKKRFAHSNIVWQEYDFMPQPDYDALLARCDWNIVRGEDSFMQAALVGKPHLWMAYPQHHNAHFPKVNAYLEKLRSYEISQDISTLFYAFNGMPHQDSVSAAWQRAVSDSTLAPTFSAFAASLTTQPCTVLLGSLLKTTTRGENGVKKVLEMLIYTT